MSRNPSILVLTDGTDPRAAGRLDPDWIETVVNAKGGPRLRIEAYAGDEEPDRFLSRIAATAPDAGIVAAGGSRFLDALPDVLQDDGATSARRIHRVNVLERCALLHEDAERAKELAVRQLRLACAKADEDRPIECVEAGVASRVAVFGCGTAALDATEALLEQGLAVTQVAAPDRSYGPVPQSDLIEFIPDAEIDQIAGSWGRFRITLRQPDGIRYVEAGAIVIAARPFLRPLRLSEEMALSGRVAALSAWTLQLVDLPSPERVCIWMDHQNQESRAVAYATFAAAEKALDLGYEVTLLFRSVPVYGEAGQERYDRVRAAGATLIRYEEPPEATVTADGIRLDVRDVILPEDKIAVHADRLIIPEKLLPGERNEQLAKVLHQSLDEEGFFQPNNVRHLPVGSPKRGVYYVGSAHRDVDPEQTIDEARAAAAQIASLLNVPTVRVPQELVSIDDRPCVGCLTCLRSCRHDAIRIDPGKRTPTFDAHACWECGVCAAVCPRKAIVRSSFSYDQLSAVLDEATTEIAGKRPTVAFLCRNSAADALEAAGRLNLTIPDDVVWIEVPCAGHISETEIVRTLVKGAGRVEVFGCHHDNCRSEIGSVSAHRQTAAVRRSLAAMGLEPDSVRFHSIAANEPYRLVHLLWNEHPATDAGEPSETKGAVHG